MANQFRVLDQIRIESPCEADWDSMIGNDQIRFCSHCRLTVNNLSEMTPKVIRRLLAESNGRLCVRYYQQPSTSLSASPPTMLHKIIGRRASRIAAGAFTAALSLSSAVVENASAGQASRPETVVSSLRSDYLTGLGCSITGTITDPNGAAINGATIVLSNEDKSVVLATSSNAEGHYRFELLQPGSYALTIQAMGFATMEGAVYLPPDGEQRVDRALRVDGVQDEAVQGTERRIVTMGAMAVSLPSDPLVRAAREDNIEEVQEALLNGAKVNSRDKATQETALECAARNGNREILQLLIRSGADVNLVDNVGQTALMQIGEQATSDIVWDLINAGAKVNLADHDGDTALTEAASSNDSDVVKTLLDAGAQVNQQNNDGQTALMKAAENGNVNNVRLLIRAGADFNLRDKDGMTAMTYARARNNATVIRLLHSYGAAEGTAKKEPEDQ